MAYVVKMLAGQGWAEAARARVGPRACKRERSAGYSGY